MKCQICDDFKGALVLANSIREKKHAWYHIVCVNYMPSIWFVEKKAENSLGVVETVKDTQTIDGFVPKSNFTLYCSICKKQSKKNPSACVQCDYQNCCTSFHVRCAIKKKLIQSWEKMNQQRVDEEDYEIFIFCQRHQDIGKRTLDVEGKRGLDQVPPAKSVEKKTPKKTPKKTR